VVTCSVKECDKSAVSRGWCDTHWRRWRRHGDLTRGNNKAIPARVLDLLQQGPRSGKDLARILEADEKTVLRALYRLRKDHKVEGSSPGVWWIPVPARDLWETHRNRALPKQTTYWRNLAACNPNNTPEVDPRWQWDPKLQHLMLGLCVRCPVKGACLDEQKAVQCDGVYGGKVFVMARLNETRPK